MKYNKIYVMGYKFVTGGPETMHQVVDIINRSGGNAYMVYPNSNDECPEEFKHYNCKFATEIEDDENNLLIVSEIATEKLFKYKKIKKCIMWLSKDYYFDNIHHYSGKIKNYKFKGIIKMMLKPALFLLDVYQKKFMFGLSKNKIIHTYNCEYLKEFLMEKGINADNLIYICGPLSKESYSDTTEKKNIVTYAYSKSKGTKYIERIIDYLKKNYPEYKYIPIKGMNHNQVINTLSEAKVYIDFGSFPGPERIPREAVLNGCNLITSDFGAAHNKVDVPIPDKYKFSKDNFNLEKISEVFLELMVEYEKHNLEFEKYRCKVRKQQEIFKNNIVNKLMEI